MLFCLEGDRIRKQSYRVPTTTEGRVGSLRRRGAAEDNKPEFRPESFGPTSPTFRSSVMHL